MINGVARNAGHCFEMLQTVKDVRQGSGHEVGGVLTQLGGVVSMRSFANHATRNSDDDRPGGDIGNHHGIRTNAGTFMHGDGTQHLGTGANNYPIFDIRMALYSTLNAGAAKGDTLVDGDVVTHGAGLADDDAGGVVDEDTLTNDGRGMDVHA